MKVDKAVKSASRLTGSPIEFRLDPASGVPTYLQLVQQVEHAVRLGYLKPGDQLPKVREVVADLAINPNTVLKSYRELEHKGLASGRPGLGTFIEGSVVQPQFPELIALRRALQGWLSDADAAGLDEEAVVALVTNTMRDSFQRRDLTADGRGRQGGARRTVGGVA